VNRLGLASLLALVMALSGAWAMPARVVESTRLVTSISWFEDDHATAEVRQRLECETRAVGSVPVIGQPAEAPVRPAPLPYSLHQRPPPTIRS
jgi:hypothetical protein